MISRIITFSVVALVVSLLIALPTTTEAREFSEIYRECGIGGLIAHDIPVLAIILNRLMPETFSLFADRKRPAFWDRGTDRAA